MSSRPQPAVPRPRTPRRTAWRTLLATTLVIGLLSSPASAQQGSLSLDPSSGPAGTTTQASGCDWNRGASVTFTGDPGGTTLGTATADGSGCIAAALQIPTSAQPGAYRVAATDQDGNHAAAQFTVTEPDAEPTPPPPPPSGTTLQITPSDALAGEEVTVSGCGWPAGSPVQLHWAESGEALATLPVDGRGCITSTLPLPADVDGDRFGTFRATSGATVAVARTRVLDLTRLQAARSLRGGEPLLGTDGVVQADTPYEVTAVGRLGQTGSGSPVERARQHLDDHAALYGIDSTTELVLVDATAVPGGSTRLLLEQRRHGIDVYGASVAVMVRPDGAVSYVHAVLLPPVPEPAPPTLAAADAVDLARGAVGAAGAPVTAEPRLVLTNRQLLHAGSADDTTRLAWYVGLGAAEGDVAVTDHLVLLDAATGEVLRVDDLDHHLDQLVYDTNGSPESDCVSPAIDFSPSTLVFDDGTHVGGTATPEAYRARDALARTVTWFRQAVDQHGHAGDPDGTEVVGLDVVHVDDATGAVEPNASYSPSCDDMKFSTGAATADIVAHEFTHGVTGQPGFSNLEYEGESGALSESFADVFAVLVTCAYQPLPCDDEDWLIGEGSSLGTLRDVRNPPDFEHPDIYGGTLWRDTDPDAPDQGNVHTNSGVPNKVASLLLLGGAFRSVGIDPLFKSQFLPLWHELHRTLEPNDDMVAAAWRSVDIAEGWASHADATGPGFFGFADDDVCALRSAWAAVSVIAPFYRDTDCDGVPDGDESDADDDGIHDSADLCRGTPWPFNTDGDGDGVGDVCDDDVDGDAVPNLDDNCPTLGNSAQADSDVDGIGDACEDSDLDGVLDPADNCRVTPNADQLDTDGDGAGDACDGDDDGDGVADGADNCQLVANADQANSDGGTAGLADPQGDACDTCPASFNPDQADADHDGLGNACDDDDDDDGLLDGDDNCPTTANAGQADLDADGVGYACDDDEQEEHTAIQQQVLVPVGGIELPIGGCASCPASVVEGVISRVVEVTAPGGGVHVRVVDALGRTVGQAPGTEEAQTVTFQPTALAYGQASAGATSSAAAAPGFGQAPGEDGSTGVPAPDLTASTLVLTPVGDTPVEVTYAVTEAPADPPRPERVAGGNRYATAAAVSASAFAPGVDVAYLATGEAFPDALAGGPAAAVTGGPVLLTRPDGLPEETAAELDRLDPASIVVLGGTAAVSEAVATAAAGFTDGEVRRIAGGSRFATAAAISAAVLPDGADVVYVATGEAFPDALAGGPAAAAAPGPVLLTGRDSLPAVTAAELDRLDPGSIVVLGGAAAVSDAVVDALEAHADEVRRLAGDDRHATATAISEATSPPGTATVYVATSGGFPDALAGGAAAGVYGAPILLVPPSGVPDVVAEELRRLRPQRIVVLGGAAVIPDAVVEQLAAHLPDQSGG